MLVGQLQCQSLDWTVEKVGIATDVDAPRRLASAKVGNDLWYQAVLRKLNSC